MLGALGFVRRILATTVAVALADATTLAEAWAGEATWDAGPTAVAAPCKSVVLLWRMLATSDALLGRVLANSDAGPPSLAVPCKAVFLLGRMELVAVLLGAG